MSEAKFPGIQHPSGRGENNKQIMKDMREMIYKRFEALLETGSYGSFEAICKRLGVSPDDMDEVLIAELGYSGEQVFDDYFGNRCKNY